MKITFVYPDMISHRPWPGYFSFGIGSISATLKQAGHQTSLIHINRPINQSDFIKRIESEDPDLIGFSFNSNMLSVVKILVSWLKESKRKVPTICGGIHPTIAPEESIRLEGMDMICRGEGEAPLVELCEKMENGGEITSIRNLWIKSGEAVIKNPLRPLMEDLDKLPFPDRSIFNYGNLYTEREGRAVFMASRGCPYGCTYCCNHLLRKIYGSEGKPVRFRSVNNVIEEIRQVLKQYPFINTLIFEDDILFLNRKWAEEFAEKYRQVVRLPFICHVRADITNEAVVNLLKKAGCVHVKFGLESGNEEIRYQILNRHMTNEQIKKAFTICKKAGLIIEAYNMVGIPYESPRSILNTIKMNATIGVDKMHVSICQPIVGTRLAELCEEKHLFEPRNMSEDSFYPDFYSVSSLNLDTISRSQVLMFRNYFKVFVRYYQFLQKLPAGTSEILIRPSDRILSFNLISKVLNQIYLPLNYFYQRLLILMSRSRVKRRKPILPQPES
jgi:radical SAM superfamily enzyme YgiQ (UPF0313 family)